VDGPADGTRFTFENKAVHPDPIGLDIKTSRPFSSDHNRGVFLPVAGVAVFFCSRKTPIYEKCLIDRDFSIKVINPGFYPYIFIRVVTPMDQVLQLVRHGAFVQVGADGIRSCPVLPVAYGCTPRRLLFPASRKIAGEAVTVLINIGKCISS